jgi:signal transduction histidine kinase
MTAAPYLINNRPAGVVTTIRDISQQAAIDKAKDEFVSLASHQLRTPLSTISWYLEMVLGGDVGKVTDEQKKYLNEVFAANQRMVTLVNSLLNVSRIDLGTFAIEPQPTDLKVTVANVLTELSSQIQTKQMKIVTDFVEGLKLYNADPKLMHIIFQNLISNAVKYTPAKGQVVITITSGHDKLLITVADNGYGIPKNQQAKIFTKLFRADNAIAKDTDGTGLGLYLIKAIVEEAGGTISFTSQENEGTTFVIKLPLTGMKRRTGTKGLSAMPAA